MGRSERRFRQGRRLARRISPSAPPFIVTDRHARGLLRRFLADERARAAEVRRRRRRQPLQGAPTLRAAHRVLENLDKAWAPRALASYTDTTPDGVARLGLVCLETEAAWLADWPGIAARSFVRRYLVRPGDTISVTMRVLEKRASQSKPHLGISLLAWTVTNQHGETVMTVKAVNLIRRRPGDKR